MRINIAASGRFHVADLSRELAKQGHDVHFYSFVPKKRLLKFGLKNENIHSLFFIMLPILACMKFSKRSIWATKLEWFILDHLIAWIMKPCDIFIAMSSIYLYSFKYAKSKYKAITILERGSNHTLDIKEIFEKMPDNKHSKKTNFSLNSNFSIKRELENYTTVDYIALGSEHVKRGFINRGISKNKLFVNPYGVNLLMFGPTELSNERHYDVIMVGNWCWRKGVDLLIEACKILNVSLLHVGGLTDIDFPKDQLFSDVGTVDEKELINYYKLAKILVLPSREDGFGMVLTQALVCGLPIVSSMNTGGVMLKKMLEDEKWITIMEETNINSLVESIKYALILANSQSGLRTYSNNIQDILSWEAYGKRYCDFLSNIKSIN